MSSLHIFIVYVFLTIVIADDKNNIYFTQSTYDIWCQENILSNSLLLYPNHIPIGIYHTSTIKFLEYQLNDDNDLFYVKTKRIADFYFFILNIIRPLDINREYQDIYIFHIQANIITKHGNYTEQAKIRLHVADSNDNDGVFNMDIYEKNFTEPIDISQPLIHFHATDADEIQHAQILYEFSSVSFNNTFSLHPYTGELYLLSKNNLQSIYEFDIYAYDRHRKYFMNNDIKAKAHVKLIFPAKKILRYVRTIFNEIIEFEQLVSSYKIFFNQKSTWNLVNIHQPILTIDIFPQISSFEIFILNNSSLNSINLFFYQNQIYFKTFSFHQYNLHLLICFFNRTKCQYTNYYLTPSINLTSLQFYFKSIQSIFINENLPIHSYITHIQLQYNNIIPNQQLNIDYKLLNNHNPFYLHRKTGILYLAKSLKYQKYFLEIQADINFLTQYYSLKTNIEINVREINKYRPIFSNNTLIELFQLPYQFQAFDFDQNKETNGRITYHLWNCFEQCSFEINPNNGILKLKTDQYFNKEKIYYLQIIAFDWGEPISLESRIDVRINLSKGLFKRDLETRWKNKSLSTINRTSFLTQFSKIETIYLNIGFKHHSISYQLSEDMEINTIIDHLPIEYDSFPLYINNEQDNVFFYLINDTSVPFTIDSTHKTLILINSLDREKQNQYNFEIELKLIPTYIIKLQEIYTTQNNNLSFDLQYSNKYYQKIFITIYINDINDNIPSCESLHQHIYLNENQIQTNIFHVQAFDPDQGENGTVIYSLLNYNTYFTINSSTGQLDCIQLIDREQISYLHLYIIASDQGQQLQLQSICMTIHITILDRNDNIPQFSLASYIFEISFDLPRETIFGQIYASDLDQSDKLFYSIDSNSYIKIDTYTGHLRLKTDLHHFINQSLNFTVKVSDGLHVNQTWIYISVKRFIEVQQPILIPEPAYSIVINQSLPAQTIIMNIYHRLKLPKASIDCIEIIHEENIIPFDIDQQGSIRLIHTITDLLNSSYWLPIRLTRYRAHPPHSFIHIHISIREENFYLPQCIDNYQYIKLYDFSIQYPFTSIQALSFYDNIHLEYTIIKNNINEKMFSINKQTGFMQVLPLIENNYLTKSDYLLTIKVFDRQHQLSVDCYLNINLIQRYQLTPKFLYSSIYNIDLIKSASNYERLRQRLFQVIALLDHEVYDKNLEVRYRIIDPNQYFIINRQTGYIATKQSLHDHRTYEFNVEAFTVAHDNDIEEDESDHDEQHSDRRKWRIVSSRVILPIKIQIQPINIINSSLLVPSSSMNKSTTSIVLLTTTKVGSIILELGKNNTYTQWFIMISQIDHTRYFHVNFQSGELILIRPLHELINKTTMIELHINVTHNWIHMDTIKIYIHIMNDKHVLMHFSQADYYTSVSKNLPIGIEIAHLTIENPSDNCTYNIHSVERIKSKDFFHIDSYSGSITIIQSLENSLSEKHLLTIIYQCQYSTQLAFTRLHINILDKDKLKFQTNHFYRFTRDNYLVIFESTLMNNQKRSLINLELINNKNYKDRIKPDAQIIQGDPLGLFSIDSSTQSLILLDESRSRSYIYPIQLTIIDTSQKEFINCTVTIFISNIGIQFTCPSHLNSSPYLFTYESIPTSSIDRFTGQQYDHYNSLTIHGFDPLAPMNIVECVMNSPIKFPNKTNDFIFDKEIYSGYINNSLFVYHNQEPLYLSIKNRYNYLNPYDITYHFMNQTSMNSFQLDNYTGIIKYILKKKLFMQYSFLILAKYQSLFTFTRLNIFIHHTKQKIYKFQLYKPFVNNYTIGYLNELNSNLKIYDKKISSMFSIDINRRLFIRNETLILNEGNFFKFFIGTIRIEIHILLKEILQCSLNRFYSNIDNDLIGFIEILNSNQKRTFHLLNYNHLFILDHEYGFLRYRNQNQLIRDDLILLIEIENARCLVTFNEYSSNNTMIKTTNNNLEMERFHGIKKSFDEINLHINNTSNILNQAPIFSQQIYKFSLHLTNNINKPIIIGQISAQPYNKNRSHLIYQFLSSTKYFYINPDNGIMNYVSNKYDNKTIRQFQIIAHDLIYQQNAIANVIIYIFPPESISLNSLIYHQTISEILPPGSIVFQPDNFNTQNFQYSLLDYDTNLFEINANTGQIILRNYLFDLFYSLKIHVSPINQILIIKLTVLDYNDHPPMFFNLPFNLTISSDDTFVTKLSAYDLDLSDNEHLKYYLLDKNQQKIFSINQTNGIITSKTSINHTSFQLKIAVSDGLHLTKQYLPITIYDYLQNSPKFSSDEYTFQYNEILGQIYAYDPDLNDRITYQLYLEPDGIQIDHYSGLITSNKTYLSPIIEFFASASDRAQQIVYTKIIILFPIQPRFTSNLYHIFLSSLIKTPSEIFHFQLVDTFNQPLSSTRFELEHSTHFLQINQNKLILKDLFHQSKIYYFNINGYWKNVTCQTTIQILYGEKHLKLNKNFYEFYLEIEILKENFFIEKFEFKNVSLKIRSTPLTIQNCTENFYINEKKLYFNNYPILSNLCFFELQFINEKITTTSQIKIHFIQSDFKPKFSSNIYYFYTKNIQVFAKSSNTIRYKLQTNSYGLIINQTTGILSFKYTSYRINSIDQIQLLVYAIDEKTYLNDTALINIILNKRKQFAIPSAIALCSNRTISISDQSLPGTIIQDIYFKNDTNNHYYILSGDKYNLFSINKLGQLYLVSSILNQTSDDYFELTILKSSSSLIYCRTNISIIRTPKWSHFICPVMPIEWMIEEECAIG
ncbi:unnamed protein product, partial [Adineta steineri]